MTSAKGYRIIENIRYYSSACDLYYHCIFVCMQVHVYKIFVFESSADMYLFKLSDPKCVPNIICIVSDPDLSNITSNDIQGLLV